VVNSGEGGKVGKDSKALVYVAYTDRVTTQDATHNKHPLGHLAADPDGKRQWDHRFGEYNGGHPPCPKPDKYGQTPFSN